MEYLLTYLIVGTAIGLLTLSYKFDKPGLNVISGILLMVLGLSMVYTDLQVPVGKIVSANTTSDNLTVYNFTNTYTSLTSSTGIKWNYWSFMFLLIGLYLIFEGALKFLTKPKVLAE